MKKHNKIKLIILIICILTIIAGAITLFLKGFEKSLEYKEGTRIEVYIPKGYEKQDVINIAKECFETDKILFSEIEKLNQVAGIKITNYSEEQLENYINKISEKYQIDKEKLEHHEILVPETKISTIIFPYLLPILFTTCLILIYITIKHFKATDEIKVPMGILKMLVITLGIYFSLIVLFRLQFCIYTMPLALAIYIVSIIISINKK